MNHNKIINKKEPKRNWGNASRKHTWRGKYHQNYIDTLKLIKEKIHNESNNIKNNKSHTWIKKGKAEFLAETKEHRGKLRNDYKTQPPVRILFEIKPQKNSKKQSHMENKIYN